MDTLTQLSFLFLSAVGHEFEMAEYPDKTYHWTKIWFSYQRVYYSGMACRRGFRDLRGTEIQSTNWNRVIDRNNDPFVCNVENKSCTVGWSMRLLCSHMPVIFRIPERYQNTAWSGIQSFRSRRFSPEYGEDIIGHIATEVYRNVAVRCVQRFI